MGEQPNKVDLDRMIKHLQVKWGNRSCPMCKSMKWNVSDAIYEIRAFNQGNLVLGQGPILPIVPVTCNNCGNSILVNAFISGAIDKSNEKSYER